MWARVLRFMNEILLKKTAAWESMCGLLNLEICKLLAQLTHPNNSAVRLKLLKYADDGLEGYTRTHPDDNLIKAKAAVKTQIDILEGRGSGTMPL